MCFNHRRFAIGALLFACSFLSAGCSDYGSGKSGAGASYQNISGIASKGPISGATVTVYQLVNGQKGPVLGVTTSGGDGSYSVTIPATSGPVLVVVTGNAKAKYFNESNPAVLEDFGVGQELRAAVPEVANAQTITVALTPLTEAAVRIATQADGSTPSADIRNANATLSNLLGLDIVATVPNNVVLNQISDINNSQDRYGVYLAAIQMQVTPQNTEENIINSFVGKIVAQNPLADTGVALLAAVNAIISDPNINPTGITELPNSITIQGAISAPVSVINTAADTTPPAAPTGLSVTLDNSKTVKLSWAASTSADTAGYIVYRNGEMIAEVPVTVYFDIQGAASATHSYTVKAFDAVRNISAVSNTATITISAAPADITPPTLPLALSATSVGSSSVTLVWNASTDNVGVAGYAVFRNSQMIASVIATGYTDNRVAANTLYRYQVQAFDAAGNLSPAGNEMSVITKPLPNPPDVTAPTQPAGLAYNSTTNSISVTWTVSTDNVGVIGYRVYRNNLPLATVPVPDYSSWAPAYYDTAVAAKTAYTYSVEAFDAAGNSSLASSDLLATTTAVQNPTDVQPPTAPTGLAALGVTTNSVNLVWNASTDDDRVAGYNIYSGGVKVATVMQPGYSDAPLLANSPYTYKVEAFDPTGNVSAFSSELTVTTLPEPVVIDIQSPTQPANLAASAITENSVSLVWTASTDNIGVVKYGVFRDGVLISSPTTVGVTDAIGLQPETTYTYKIKAFDAAGNTSLFSPELSVTTLRSSDATAPTAPTGLAASSITTTSLTLAWLASTDNVGVVRYDVYRNGVKAGSTAGGIRSYSDTALSPGATYKYKVQAFDAADNASPFSAEFVADTRTNIVVDVSGQITGISGLPGTISTAGVSRSPP